MNVSLKIDILVDSANAAFGDSHVDAFAEIDRILREACAELRPVNNLNIARILRDINGNRVGRLNAHVEVTA